MITIERYESYAHVSNEKIYEIGIYSLCLKKELYIDKKYIFK